MGSLVGGIFAAGMSPDEMEKRIGAINWSAIFRDNPEREDIPWRQKRDDFTSLSSASNWGFATGNSSCPWEQWPDTSSSSS